jgi:hypothetical protein
VGSSWNKRSLNYLRTHSDRVTSSPNIKGLTTLSKTIKKKMAESIYILTNYAIHRSYSLIHLYSFWLQSNLKIQNDNKICKARVNIRHNQYSSLQLECVIKVEQKIIVNTFGQFISWIIWNLSKTVENHWPTSITRNSKMNMWKFS